MAVATMSAVVALASGCGQTALAPAPSTPGGAACPSVPTTRVQSAAELTSALRAARAGETIMLEAGSYGGRFSATVSGSAAAPITLCGSSTAVIEGGDVAHGYALHLDHASYWRLVGFRITGGQKGLVLDGASHDRIVGLTVDHVGDEGIHLREGSSDDVVEGTTVAATGLLDKTYGEGIYVGTATSNWCQLSGCGPDRSDDDQLLHNRISSTPAETIDVKEGTTGTVLRGNVLTGSPGVVGSVVNLKGNDAVVVGNVITGDGRDGIQIHTVVPGWGSHNRVGPNTFMLTGASDAVRIDGSAERAGNTVSCGQRIRGSGWRGAVSNVGCH